MPLQQAQLTGNPFRLYIQFRRDPIQFLQATQSLGDLVQIPSVNGQSSFIVHHPEIVRVLLAVEEQKLVKGKSARILGYTLGRGLLTSEKPAHGEQRRMLQPAFHASMLAEQANRIVQLTQSRVAHWPHGQAFKVSDELLDLTLDIVFETLFGAEVGEDRARLHEIIEYSVQFSAKKLLSALSAPMWLPTPANRRHQRLVVAFDEVIGRLMAQGESRNAHVHQAGMAGGGDVPAANILDYLYQFRGGNGEWLAADEIRDELATLIIGGHETTANLLAWVLYLLDGSPEVRMQMEAEVDEILGGRPPSFDDVRKLTYMRQVLKESLRLYPPAWTILRETIDAVEIEGLTIPAKSSIIISPYVLHRNSRWHDNPNSFVPERFADDDKHEWDKFAYIPFGAGSRTCIGNTFAMMEATLVLAVILQRLTWQVAPGSQIHPEPSVSLRIRGGLKIVAQAKGMQNHGKDAR